MLYLNPPYNIINGVVVFSDHANPLQFYYLPLMPKLTMLQDQVTSQMVPQIQIIKYRGDAGNGGILNFDVNLGIEQKTLASVRDQLQQLMKLHDTPLLAPVPLVSGTVKMMLFGKQTGDPGVSAPPVPPTGHPTTPPPTGTTTTGTVPAGPQFVLKINQAGTPSLYGDNQAAFSVLLDQEGITILDQAIQGEFSPIGIVYSLDYLALRPAYSVTLKIDWQRVQTSLDTQFGVDSIFASVDIDTAVDKLIENRAIVLEADTFIPEGEDTSTISARRDRALNEVRDMITNAFFEPSINPVKDEKDGWDKALQVAERGSAIASTGGMGGIASFKYKKTDYTRIDQKQLNVNISERTTVKCSIYPQGHLSGLFRTITQAGLDLTKFILSVDLADPFFAHRSIELYSRSNFETDSIASLNVGLQYGNDFHNSILDSSTATDTMRWSSILQNGVMQREVKTSYKVTFKNVDGTQRPLELSSPEQTFIGDKLEINARELYSIVSVPITPLSFPWDLYPQVEVHVTYSDDQNGIQQNNSFLLDSKNPEQTWNMFIRDAKKKQFRYSLLFHGADGKDITPSSVETEDQWIRVRDPYPRRRTVTISPDLDWTVVKRAFVDISYEDSDNSVDDQQSYSFSQTSDNDQVFSVSLVNPNLRIVTYTVTVVFLDGHMFKTPNSATLGSLIIVTSTMKGHKIVTIQPQAVAFASVNLQKVTLSIRYHDDAAGLSYSDVFTFKSMGDVAHFEYDYVNENAVSYQYQLIYQYGNGLSRSVDWTTALDEVLPIPIS